MHNFCLDITQVSKLKKTSVKEQNICWCKKRSISIYNKSIHQNTQQTNIQVIFLYGFRCFGYVFILSLKDLSQGKCNKPLY